MMGKPTLFTVFIIVATAGLLISVSDAHKHKKSRAIWGKKHKLMTHMGMKKLQHLQNGFSKSKEKSGEEDFLKKYDVAGYSKHKDGVPAPYGKHVDELKDHLTKMKERQMRKKAKKMKKNKLGWMKFKSEDNCFPKCGRGEFCITGPLDSKPFCVRKKNLKKSIKLFHRYQKKERKQWRKFQKEHYKHMDFEPLKEKEMKKSHIGKMKEKHIRKKGYGHLLENKGKKHLHKPLVPPYINEDDECHSADFGQMRTRLMGWFHVLHGQDHLLKRKEKGSLKHFHKHVSVKKELRENNGASCQCFKSAMWQFNELDKDKDDHLSKSELDMVEENSMEPCVQPYLTSCDRDADGVLTSDEWCCCFSSIVAPCFQKLEELRKSPEKVSYMPRCDREGYYMREQCQGDVKGDKDFGCWCVDYNGNEYKGTFINGRAHCSKIAMRGLVGEKTPML